MNLAQVIQMRQVSNPMPLSKRKFAEDCQYGDIVEWVSKPRVRLGEVRAIGPSCEGVVTMRVGPAPATAFVRFFVEGRTTLPYQIEVGQPLVVRVAR